MVNYEKVKQRWQNNKTGKRSDWNAKNMVVAEAGQDWQKKKDWNAKADLELQFERQQEDVLTMTTDKAQKVRIDRWVAGLTQDLQGP